MEQGFERWEVESLNEKTYEKATYQAYCNRVCAVLKKATQKEKDALSKELLDHMESHTDTLVDLGWDPQEARLYAIQAMGDPEMVGRQYDEKLSSFWLWCGRVAWTLCIVLVVWMAIPFIGIRSVLPDMIAARWNPSHSRYGATMSGELLVDEEIDLSIPTPSGKHVIRVYRTCIYQRKDDGYRAQIFVVGYPKNFFGIKSDLLKYVTVEGYPAVGYSSGGFEFCTVSPPVEKGQETVELMIRRKSTGTEIRVNIPLNWEDVP